MMTAVRQARSGRMRRFGGSVGGGDRRGDGRPVVLVRGYGWRPSDAGASVLVMERERDLFP